jgi:hypothetical protein
VPRPPVLLFLWGTDWERQPIQNDAALAAATPGLWTRWKHAQAARLLKAGLGRFFGAAAASPAGPAKASSGLPGAANARSTAAAAAARPITTGSKPGQRRSTIAQALTKGSIQPGAVSATKRSRSPAKQYKTASTSSSSSPVKNPLLAAFAKAKRPK